MTKTKTRFDYKNKRFYLIVWDILFIAFFLTELIISHSAISTAALAVFSLYSVFVIIVSDLKAFAFSYIIVLYALFIFVCYLGTRFGSVINAEASGSFLKTVLYSLAFMFCACLYIKNKGYDSFIKTFEIAVFITSLISFIIIFLQTGSFLFRGVEKRISNNLIAVFCAIAICFVLFDLRRLKAKSIPLLLIYGLFIISSGTRKAALALVIGLLVIIYLSFPKRLISNVIITAIIALVLYLVVIKIPFVYNILGVRIESLIRFINGGEGDASITSRSKYIELGLEAYKSNRIWGIGLNGFRQLEGSNSSYAHNNYVELLCDTGLIGTISYYFMHFTIFLRSIIAYFKRRRRNTVFCITLLVIIVFIDFAIVSYYERSINLLLVLCALLLSEDRVYDEKF